MQTEIKSRARIPNSLYESLIWELKEASVWIFSLAETNIGLYFMKLTPYRPININTYINTENRCVFEIYMYAYLDHLVLFNFIAFVLVTSLKIDLSKLKMDYIQWGLHLRIGSTSEPLMRISFHLLKNNDPKIAKMLWT